MLELPHVVDACCQFLKQHLSELNCIGTCVVLVLFPNLQPEIVYSALRLPLCVRPLVLVRIILYLQHIFY